MQGNDRSGTEVTDKEIDQIARARTEAVLNDFEGYMWTICRGHLSDLEDANDAFQDASMKIFRCFQRGATFGSEQQLKTYVRLATKGAVLDLLRKQYGDRKKKGSESPSGRRDVQLTEALEKAMNLAGLSAEESRQLVDGWAELIGKEAGYDVAIVFKLTTELLTEAEIAEKLGIRLSVVKGRLDEAFDLLVRHLKRRRN